MSEILFDSLINEKNSMILQLVQGQIQRNIHMSKKES